jgi:serine protease
MKTAIRRRLAVSALTLMALGASAALPTAGVERGPLRRATAAVETEARVIVKFKADSALMRALSATAQPQHAQALSARLGLALVNGRAIGRGMQVLRSAGMSSRQLAQRLAAESDVEFAEVDERKFATAMPNDALYPGGQITVTPAVGQWYLRAPTGATITSTSSVVSSIDIEPAWAITTGSASVVVADLDTGVRFDHPDFKRADTTSKLLAGYDFVSGDPASAGGGFTTAADGNGRDADASDPGDFGCGDTTSSWHGTQTAGLIGAATNNSIGMASVGREVMVLPVRVLGCGGGYDSDIQAAMLWAAGVSAVPVANTHPAKVINMSLGATGTCSAAYTSVFSQVIAAGAVVVVSAGNEGLDVGTPANCAGAIAVAGVRHSGTKVGYSDLGSKIAIAAPAGNCVNGTGTCLYPIITTSNSGATTPVAATYTSGGNDASLGTSFSAPLVSGVAALMISANPTLTPAQVLAAIKSSARAFPSSGAGTGVNACTAPASLTDTTTAQTTECYCTTATCGAGMLDAGAAVTTVTSATASITAAATSVNVGGTLTLDGTQSTGSPNRSISSYQWAIVSGGTAASLSGATNGPTATLTGLTVGSAVVSLTVVDSVGAQATTSVTVAAVTPPAASGGGGGAMSLGWLLAWLAAVTAVWAVTPRRSVATTAPQRRG